MIKSSRPIRTKPPLEGVKLDAEANREMGGGDMSLTGLAVAEATQRLSPEERQDLITRLLEQQKFLRTIETD